MIEPLRFPARAGTGRMIVPRRDDRTEESVPAPLTTLSARPGREMNLLELITLECIKAPLAAADKKGIIGELVDTLDAAGKVADPAALKDAVWSREQARTTGIGHGLAIPHGKSDAVRELAMAIGRPSEPIDFGSIDGKPVRLVVLLASPVDRTNDHIQALARISRMIMNEEFRERIYAASTAEEVYEILQEHEAASSSAR